MIKYSCSFTGRRNLEGEDIDLLCSNLKNEIKKLIQKNHKTFLVGGAIGFDTIAAQTILSLKNTYSFIELYLVLPSPDYGHNWDEYNKKIFNNIKDSSDKIIHASTKKVKGCNHIRNRYLIDNSSICIAYSNIETGGSAYTVKYAQKKGIKVINLAEQ